MFSNKFFINFDLFCRLNKNHNQNAINFANMEKEET